MSNLQYVSWDDVRDDVKNVNPVLAEIIDDLSPDKRFKLVKATYKFGDFIVKDGHLQLPTDKGVAVPITDVRIDKNIRLDLNYSSIPLSLLLNKISEIFIPDDERAIPLNILEPGSLFGTFETTDYMFAQQSKPIWSVAAGARSILMLPRISEAGGLKKLLIQYGMHSSTRLKSLADHWKTFVRISNSPDFTDHWNSEIIFFSKTWFDKKFMLDWQRYLFEQAWTQSQYAIAKFEFGLFWRFFIKRITERALKPNTYIADTIKCLLAIAIGAAPAFRPADDSQLAAPTSGLEEAFINTYGLKNYLPTFLYPKMLENSNKENSVYYALNFPTLLEGEPSGKSSTTIMLDIKEIKLLLDTLLQNLEQKNNLIPHIKFEYFHVENDKYGEIQSSQNIPNSDPAFIRQKKKYPDRQFCSTSPFWRGCIKISGKVRSI